MSRFADAPPPPLEAPLLPEEPPKWPKVVGILSIVLGSLGLMCSLCGVGWFLYLPTFGKQMEPQMGPMPPAMSPSPVQIGLVAIGFLWAALLLAAGISTVTRKRSGRPMHIAYGIASLLTGVPGMALAAMQQMQMASWMTANPDSKWAQNSSPVGAIVGLAFGVIVGLGWPLFCLIWFAPAKHSPDVNAPDHI